MKDRLSWLALLVLAGILVVGGMEGSIGRLLGCLFVPDQIVLNE